MRRSGLILALVALGCALALIYGGGGEPTPDEAATEDLAA
jgi:hypothetical protein